MSTAATPSQVTPIQPPQVGPASTPKPEAPQPPQAVPAQLEAEVRKLSADLDKAEGDAEKTGREFGKKLIELRELRKKDKRQGWIDYLKQYVGISYEKARYWINVVEGKSNHRRYHEFGAAPNGGSGPSAFQRPLKDWQAALKRLNEFMVPLKVLYNKGEKGSDMLRPVLKELAAIAGCQLVEPPKSPNYPEPAPENFAALRTKPKPPVAKPEKSKTKAELEAEAQKAEEKAEQEAADKVRQADNEAATDRLDPYGTDEDGKLNFPGKQDSGSEQVVQ